jgi:hypothetical protein
MVPMHLGLIDGPFVPHNLISTQESPVPLLKFQMVPRLKILMASKSNKEPSKGAFPQADLEGGLLYWGTQKMRFLRDMQNALRQSSLFIEALLGNLEGVCLPGLLGDKKSQSGCIYVSQHMFR